MPCCIIYFFLKKLVKLFWPAPAGFDLADFLAAGLGGLGFRAGGAFWAAAGGSVCGSGKAAHCLIESQYYQKLS